MSGGSPTNTDSMASSSFSGGGINRTKRMRAMIATQISKRITNPYKNHPHIKGLKYVIFPNSTKILWWDFLMILVVFYYAFWIPYHFLETIPYLSSKYLSPDEQAEVALQCRTLEFAAGEHFRSHPEFGRGIVIFKHGLGFTSRNQTKTNLAGHEIWGDMQLM